MAPQDLALRGKRLIELWRKLILDALRVKFIGRQLAPILLPVRPVKLGCLSGIRIIGARWAKLRAILPKAIVHAFRRILRAETPVGVVNRIGVISICRCVAEILPTWTDNRSWVAIAMAADLGTIAVSDCIDTVWIDPRHRIGRHRISRHRISRHRISRHRLGRHRIGRNSIKRLNRLNGIWIFILGFRDSDLVVRLRLTMK